VKPIAQISAASCRAFGGVFCDIDDTLTTHGRLPAVAFAALWRLRAAGLRVVPITGRPAGWCDHIARMWPVDAVIGENGAFWFAMGARGIERRWVQDEETRCRARRTLDELGAGIVAEVAGVQVAADQPYRESDLAIDFAEDVPFAGQETIDAVVARFHAAGATCKVSSIHVNGWFGDFDKLATARQLVAERFGEDLDARRHEWLFVGDSPNDEPGFAFFPSAVGVANVARFLPRLTHAPAWIAQAEGGEGFAEIVDVILSRRT
jgi:HAD superfamily hydrolase (TIGR01484 family)